MKIKVLVIVVALVFMPLFAPRSFGDETDVTYEWTKQMGGPNFDSGKDITTDSSGNVYIIGTFEDTVDFGADFGTIDSKTSAGDYDIFVTRINSDGTYGWTKQMGGTGYDSGQNIITDSSGNVYVTGYFWGTVNFGADFETTDSKTSAGDYDIFVTRINSDGTYGWTKQMGSTAYDYEEGLGITSDLLGNVYVTGFFVETVNFGADWGETDQKAAVGFRDIFVTKINSDGTYGWTKQMGGTDTGADVGYGITTDSSGNIYVTGHFQKTTNFGADWGETDQKTVVGFRDIFVTRINSDGTYGWTRRMGATGIDYGYGITTDSSGDVYVIGWFLGTVNFRADWGDGTDWKTAAGNRSDIFVTKINSDGSYGWTKRMGVAGKDCGYGITSDSSGNFYVTGFFEDRVDFRADWGDGTDWKTEVGLRDIFVTRINSDGTYGWTKQMGSTGYDVGYGITTDSSGNVYVTGAFKGTVDFGADFGTTDSKTSAGGVDDSDIFVTKIRVGPVVVAIDIKPGSDLNSINLRSAGVISVAILSSDTFDATTVDPETVTLAGAGVKMAGKSGKYLSHESDVNSDGLPDLVCQVLTAAFEIEPGASIAVLKAETFEGKSIRGEDAVRIVPDK